MPQRCIFEREEITDTIRQFYRKLSISVMSAFTREQQIMIKEIYLLPIYSFIQPEMPFKCGYS